MVGWKDDCYDGWMNGRLMDGWIVRRMDGWICG
jgi:hypothetical protein